ncbi:MAG: ABC transporter substrate-binding protein [Chloroflexota bacterium]
MLIGRRAFLVFTTATLAAACAPSSPPPAGGTVMKPAAEPGPAASAAAPAARPPAAQASVRKQELIVGIAGEPADLDPTNALGNVGVRLLYPLMDGLLRRDFLDGNRDGNKLVPSLATEWRRTSDLTLEVKLRPGVTFHDGSKMTADDVKFTFEHILDPKNPGEARGYFATIEKVDVTGPDTVVFKTKAPDPLLEQRMASYGSWIIPRAHFERVGNDAFIKAPVAAGPYKITEWKRDAYVRLERHEDYWADKPAFKTITFRLIPETATRVSALLSGEVDIITNLPPDQIATVEADSGSYVRGVPLANAHVLKYNTAHPALSNVLIRRALNLAIDREGLVRALWRGKATVPRGFQFEGEFGSSPHRRPLEYKPERAKSLLAEARYEGTAMVFRTAPNYYSNGRQAAEAIVEMWKKVGLNASVEVLEQAAINQIDANGGTVIGNWSATSTLGDPDGYLWRNWGPDNSFQKLGYWKPDEYNRLGQEARTSLDQKRRLDIYQRMMDIYEEDAPGTVLYIPFESYGLRRGVDWTPYPIYYFDPRAYNLKQA